MMIAKKFKRSLVLLYIVTLELADLFIVFCMSPISPHLLLLFLHCVLCQFLEVQNTYLEMVHLYFKIVC